MSGSTFGIERVDRIAVITFDLPGAPLNTLSRATGAELLAVLDRLETDDTVDAIVLRSGKPHCFIAGADIHEFAELATAEQARALSTAGQALLDRRCGGPRQRLN